MRKYLTFVCIHKSETPTMNENKQNFFNSQNLLSLIFSKWKPLLIIAIIAAVGSAIVSFYMPQKFKAQVVLFPAQNNNLSRAILSQQADDTKDFLAFGEDNNADQLLQVLKSDALMYALEKKFDLIKYYKLENKWDKYYLFKGYYNDLFEYTVTEYESLVITVYDQNPKMAADMANAAASLADSLMREITHQRAVAAFKIVRAEYDSAVFSADKLEDSLQFYNKLGMLEWQYQARSLTQGYADAVVKGNAEAVKTLSDKISMFGKYGKGFMELTNELEGSYEWFKQARASYMQAKIDAEQSIPSFFVVDKAVPADRKTYPIRALVVLIGTGVALVFSILVLLIMNRLKGSGRQ